MKSEIQFARARRARTGELADAARYAREQLVVYRGRADSPQVESPGRLRELEQASRLAELRLKLAQSARDPNQASAEAPMVRAGFRGETDDGVQFE